MTADDYLTFLAEHQPMPGDAVISDTEGELFAAALKHFEAHPDVRCLPLLINAVSKETGLGMYEHIKFVLLAHPRDSVLPHLAEGLRSGRPGVAYRCCWWSMDLGVWDLLPLVRPLMAHPDADVQAAASDFVELASEQRVSGLLRQGESESGSLVR